MAQLIPSSKDKVAFTREVWKRVVKVTNQMERKKGLVFIPPDIEKSLLISRAIAKRHEAGDYRHTEYEMRHEQTVARWLVEQHAELNGNPVPELKFGPHS